MDQETSHIFSNLLVKHILGGNAFIKIEEIVNQIDYEKVGLIYPGLPYSFWQLFEHMRIAQKDILEFSIGPGYQELNWPEEYWPEKNAPDSPEHWNRAKEEYFRDRQKFNDLINIHSQHLIEPFPHGNGQNLFREALLVLEHNAYHTGQLMIISRLLTSP